MKKEYNEDSFKDEKILLKEFKNGDISSFKVLIKKYEQRLLKSAIWFIGNKDDALDIVEDVFLYVFQNINKFREESGFYTWLYWILLDRIKRKRLKNKIKDAIFVPLFSSFNKDDEKEEEIFTDNKENVLDNLEKNERTKKIFDIINSLDEKYKSSIILCDIDGLSYKQAGMVLGCNETTIKIRLFRARMKLREKISKEHI